MSGKIYLLQNNSELVPMTEERYDSESLLQKLLSDYPDLLAGDQMNSNAPRRWLLVKREMEVPDAADASGRWYLDHLFLDQDGIPTLVEVKRSTDTRLRREVIGQMLDYAANGVVYWPVETLKTRFMDTWKEGADQKLAEFLNLEDDTEASTNAQAFWQKVGTNLQAGRVRLVFVADVIPPELQRVIEFLNEQMELVEVLAVEIKQYVGKQMQTLVPRVVGQTTKAEAKKSANSTGSGAQWNKVRFFEDMEQRNNASAADIARKLYEWAVVENNMDIQWGTGQQDGSFTPLLNRSNQTHKLFVVYTYGRVEIYFGQLSKKPPFNTEAKLEELRVKLNAINGVNISKDKLTGRPPVSLNVFAEPTAWAQLLTILKWVVDEIQKLDAF